MNEAGPLVEHFFRHESANLVAVLTRAFGLRRLELVEDMVQQAMVEAMHAWKQRGLPDSPAAWIHRAAKNRVLDALRREKTHEQALAFSGQARESEESLVDQWLESERLPDSLLRMMFACCHPTLDRKTQIALTLSTLCGFSCNEIARGLLLGAETVKKRVQRAKKTLADANVSLDLPSDDALILRRAVVHDVLYLMFNEGYSTSRGVEPIRDDVCEEAARLCHLLCESPLASAATKALLALLLFHSARLESRTDAEGRIVLLEDQDRGRWDRRLIGIGSWWLAESKPSNDRLTTYHLEAAISQQHCLAASVEKTDWPLIVQLYDRLLVLHDSPIYRLNRAIAQGQAGASDEALEQLQELSTLSEMEGYPLLDCAMARIYELSGRDREAAAAYQAALAKHPAPHEVNLIQRKLQRHGRPFPG